MPEDDKAIQAQITSGIDGEGNGYQLLWNIAKLNVPIFDPTKPVSCPKWPGCIHRLAQLFDLHHELACHCGLLLSFYNISETFLENTRLPLYMVMADTRLVNLRSFEPADPGNGSPSHEWSLPAT